MTLFPDFAARSLRTGEFTLPALAELARTTAAAQKSALPWIKLARFGDAPTDSGALRNNANVLGITGVEGDYDGEVLEPGEAAAILEAAGVEALIYTSPSHHPFLPRWRVLCPLSEEMPGGMRAELIGRVNYALGGVLAGESFTLSQAYYIGGVGGGAPVETFITAGRPIDLVEMPALYPVHKRAEPILLPPAPAGQEPDERARQALAAALQAFIDLRQDRHATVLAATLLCAPFVKSGHLDGVEVVEAIHEACTESGREPNPAEVSGALYGALPRVAAYVAATGDEFDPLPPAPEAPPSMVEFTEDHAARTFAMGCATSYRYDHSDLAWYVFGPDGWTKDNRNRVVDDCRHFLHSQREQWGLTDKEARKAASASFIMNTLSLSKSDATFATTSAEWDLDPFALGVPGGYVDLRTGEHHRAAPHKLMRRRTAVAPATGPAPVWERFLRDATGGDPALEGWLQRFAGYALTGEMSEEMLAFVYGPGKNGKGVFLGALAAVLGSYAYQAPAALFDANNRANREYQLANLEGVRLLMVSETEAGSVLAEAFVKEITGNEGPINARHPYGRPFTFRLQTKVLIVGNHAPKLTGRTEAMERRLRVVPFTHRPPVQDATLKRRLEAEYPQILAWMIEGCVAWQRERLGVCEAVQRASSTYFAEQDVLAQWVEERCEVADKARVPSATLLEDLNGWLRTRGEKPLNARDFKEAWGARMPGNPVKHSRTGSVVDGIELRTPSDPLLD